MCDVGLPLEQDPPVSERISPVPSLGDTKNTCSSFYPFGCQKVPEPPLHGSKTDRTHRDQSCLRETRSWSESNCSFLSQKRVPCSRRISGTVFLFGTDL